MLLDNRQVKLHPDECFRPQRQVTKASLKHLYASLKAFHYLHHTLGTISRSIAHLVLRGEKDLDEESTRPPKQNSSC